MQVIVDNLPLILVLVAGVSAPVSGWLAATRDRRRSVWFVLGALIGPLAWLLLVLAPPGRCPTCGAIVHGWPLACERCGSSFDGSSRATGAPLVPAEGAALHSVPPPGPHRPTVGIDEDRGRRPAGRIVRPAAERRPRLVPMPSMSEVIAGHDEPVVGERVLAAGVYLSGNAGLEVGATYAIALVGSRLRIFGPVDAGQLTVRQEGELDQFDVLGVEDRLVISGRGGRSSLAIIFRAIGGMPPAELEMTLKAALDSDREVS